MKSLSSMLLMGAIAGAAGGLIAQLSPLAMTEARVQQIVDANASGPKDSTSLDASIEKYLLDNPRILERVSAALEQVREDERRERSKAQIEANRDVIYDGLGNVEVGNPDGDVTLVELYDYNCSYCRSALPDVATLLAEDTNLRLLLRQFPILSQGSVDAAKVGTLVAREGVDYWSFHQAMFTSRGQVDLETALSTAGRLGLDAQQLRDQINSKDVEAALAESFGLAQRLGVNGTPTFILADEIIPGAIGIDALRQKIANVRACGSTRC